MSTASLSDAERMDRHYRYQRYIYDATRTRYLIGRGHLIRQLSPPTGGAVLEIGCGTAWNLIRAARTYPGARLYGVDVSNAMLGTARASIRRRGLASQIGLYQGDATNFDPGAVIGISAFDRIFFSYALSMIPGWRQALAHAASHIAPGGELHIVDFGQCEQLPAAFKRGLFAFLDHYTVTPRADLEDEIRRVSAPRGLTYTFERLHRGYTQYAVLRRPR